MTDTIARVEAYRLELPYRHRIQFHGVADTSGPYVLLRLITQDGAQGIAETVARAQLADSADAATLVRQIGAVFAPRLRGASPFDAGRLLDACPAKGALAARALIDVALWDLKGKLLGQPVWRLIGSGPVAPVPVTHIVFGDTAREVIEDAVRAVRDRGIRSLKLKAWKRSMADAELVRDVRSAVGGGILITVDANGTYSDAEARAVFPHLAAYDVKFVEDPSAEAGMQKRAALAAALPLPVLADAPCKSLAAVHSLVSAGAAGAVAVKLRRLGLTQAVKIAALGEAAGVPVLVGSDLESRIGAAAPLHLRAALASLEPWPAEIGFFDRLADDLLAGAMEVENGCIRLPEGPGFGVSVDPGKLARYGA